MTDGERDDDLLRAFIDNTLDDHTHQLLQDRLLTDPGLRRDCLQLLQIDALLSWRSGLANSALPSNPGAEVDPHEWVQPRLQRQPRPNETIGKKNITLPSKADPKPNRLRPIRLGLAAALVLFLLGGVLLLDNHLVKNSELPSGAVAKLKDVIVESGQTLMLNAEEFLGREILTQDNASAAITFADGTEVVLESETQVELDIQSPNNGKGLKVYAGQVKVSASPQPKDRPLIIRSPHGTVTVLGTEFLLNVDQNGTVIGLLEGTVNLTRLGDNAALQLLAGQRATLAPETTLVATPLKSANGQLWTPADSTASAWYDADDASTIVGPGEVRNANRRVLGVKVSQWKDKSGNNHHVSAQGLGHAFVGKTSNLNGVIKFYKASSLQNADKICDQPFSFAVVAGSPRQYYHDTPFFDGNGTERCIVMGSTNKITMNAGQTGPSLKKTSGLFMATGVFNGASSVMQINGSASAIGDAGSGDLSQGITIGRRLDSDPNVPFQGDIGEIIIISGKWSTEEQQKFEGYLAHKWGIRLPEIHPYKTTPPQKQ